MTKAPRGTKDLFGSDMQYWHFIEKVIGETTKTYGFSEIRTPIFEHTELFLRGVGDTTDIVQKEMYTFESKGKDYLTLRPEGTAGVARAFIEQKLYAEAQPTKLYYVGPMFRYERPQAGRQRQFHQFGVEMFGSKEATAEVEIISLAMEVLKKLGIEHLELNINTLGNKESREKYNTALKSYLESKLPHLCETCNERYEKNPLRILDCKNESCKELVKDAPTIFESLTEEDQKHFEEVQCYLKEMDIPFKVDPNIVRGLDYYTRTVFEIISNDIGAQGTVCGGGRYDTLLEQVGGPQTPAVGFGLGIERLILTMQSKKIEIPNQPQMKLFIANIGEVAKKEAHKIMYQCRKENISCEADHLNRSLKAQMKYANKLNARYTIVLGEEEINKKVVQLKEMETGIQKEIHLNDIIDYLK